MFNLRGGGIQTDAPLTLNDCVFVNNQGGAIDGGSFFEMNRCTVANNSTLSARMNEFNSVSEAAGITVSGGTITNSTIVNNDAINQELTDPARAVRAGGIVSGGNLSIVGCTISGNRISGSSQFSGSGGVFSAPSNPATIVTDTIIAGNTHAPAPDASGPLSSGGYNLIGDKTGSTGFAHGVNRDQVGGGDRPVVDARLGMLGDNGGPTPTMAVLSDSPAIDQGRSSLSTDQRGVARRFDVTSVANAEGGDGSDVGSFELVTSDPLPTPSPNPSVTPTAARLLNISTRARVQTGDKQMIGGFIITGGSGKNVVVRALGPSLADAGLQNVLPDPRLQLFDSQGALVDTNNNWRDNSAEAAQVQNRGLAPKDDRESALAKSLASQPFTAVVSGASGESGFGLVEVYDVDDAGKGILANISTRGFVGVDDEVLIGGFIVGGGQSSAQVVLRALGPSLSSAGVSGALEDPTIELRDANASLVRANDNWKESQRAELEARNIQPPDDRESALIVAVPSGAYTAIVRGKDARTGVGLVEIYNVP